MNLLSIFKKTKERDINLLTREEAKPTSAKLSFLPLILIPMLTLAVLTAVFLIVFALEQREKIRQSELASEIDQKTNEWKRYEDIAKVIYQVKTNIDKYQKIAEKNTGTKNSLNLLSKNIPQTVALAQLTLKDSGEASLTGASRDPKSIFQFFVVLINKPEFFSDVKLTSIGYKSEEEDDDKTGGGSSSGGEKLYRFNIEMTIKGT
jgi:Tfp pilus assembly protein PilN